MEINQLEVLDIEENSQLKQEAREQVKLAIEKYKIESQVSKQVKLYFDRKYGPNWHCIVGILIRKELQYNTKLSE